MSIPNIRRALEKRLAAMTGVIATAYEDVPYTPVDGTPYQHVDLLPAEPDNTVQGSRTFIQRGLFQITLFFPLGSGPGARDAYLELLRQQFKRGTTLTEAGSQVLVYRTPSVAKLPNTDNRSQVAVSVPFESQVIVS